MMNKNAPATMEEIQKEVRSVLGETEDATLFLGDQLSKIVRRAEEFVDEIRAEVGSLDSSEERSVTRTLDRQCQIVVSFISEVQSAVTAQDKVADEVLDTSRTVMEAAEAVASISMQSRILCFNTMVEAGRLGEKGRPFMVIAGEMRELSERIAQSNEQVSRLASDLMPLLKDVKRSIAALKTETTSFSQRYQVEQESLAGVTERLRETAHRSLAAGDEKIAAIVECSSKALMDLQVQDLVSQRLKRALRLTGTEATGGTFLSENLGSSDSSTLAAADLMLFGT